MKRDTLTVMVCESGKRATKEIIAADEDIEILGYNAGVFFNFRTFKINDIDELSTVLKVIEDNPKTFIIRGVQKEGLDEGACYRRVQENFETPLEGHHWLEIDVDKILLPNHIYVKTDTQSAIEHVVSLLPAEFHNASFHWQLSSSAGFSNHGNQISVHLWYWLEDPVPDLKLREWGKAVNAGAGVKLIDTALFNGVQPHFVAKPILKGIEDPFPIRSGFVAKSSPSVLLKLLSPTAVAQPVGGVNPNSSYTMYDTRNVGFEAKLAAIGDHPGGEGFHLALIAAAASFVVTEGTEPEMLAECKNRLRETILNANHEQHEITYVEQIASDKSLDSAINSAVKKFGGCAQRKSRIIKGIKPHYNSEYSPVGEAQGQIGDAFADWS